MKKKTRRTKTIFLLFIAIALAGGIVVLGAADIPAPVHKAEKPLDAAKFLK